MWQHGRNMFLLLYWTPLPSWKRSVSSPKDWGRKCPGKILYYWWFYPLLSAQSNGAGLIKWGEEGSLPERGLSTTPLSSCKVVWGPAGKGEPNARAVLHPSQQAKETFYGCPRRGIWRLGGSTEALMPVREISQMGIYPIGGEGREQPLLCYPLPSLWACSSAVHVTPSTEAL